MTVAVNEHSIVIKEDIQSKQALYLSTSHDIHEYPEIGNEEYCFGDRFCGECHCLSE